MPHSPLISAEDLSDLLRKRSGGVVILDARPNARHTKRGICVERFTPI